MQNMKKSLTYFLDQSEEWQGEIHKYTNTRIHSLQIQIDYNYKQLHYQKSSERSKQGTQSSRMEGKSMRKNKCQTAGPKTAAADGAQTSKYKNRLKETNTNLP